ncbi:hypothetical protein EJ571_12750 [Mycobacteroides franklinii]|uniref:Xanthine dehydrogenase subunit A n=2 Tax=Mycobacteroides franklinii TaxID=948102 RepID=A0A4R5PDF1_9MYCO|nr:hypothetical protein BST24_00425 [Mycobacteroides franklinii]TDH22751.1 hypothetical protein EJ571_12750 [Mycobacteroides franklinii]
MRPRRDMMINHAVLQWIWDRYCQHGDVITASAIDAPARSPYPAGSMMAFDRKGGVAGSVSPGCVEADLYARVQQIFLDHRDGLSGMSCYTVHFEAGTEVRDVISPPHACGGTLMVAIHPVTPTHFPELPDLLAACAAGRPIYTELDLRNGCTTLASGQRPPAPGMFRTRYEAPKRLLAFGISDIAVELANLAPRLGYAVTVCDPRSTFLRPDRFPAEAELVADWPDRYLRQQRAESLVAADTAVVDLSHEERFSIPLLLEALDSRRWPNGDQPGYVGALGSRARCAQRRRALREWGLPADEEARLHAPIGLDLGGRLAPHIALSIAAELIAEAAGGSAMPLTARYATRTAR